MLVEKSVTIQRGIFKKNKYLFFGGKRGKTKMRRMILVFLDQRNKKECL
jgi:hypothetical protein